jgi:ribulose 1,5-bisphosphate synthetase/thiazole synthase
MRIREAPGCAGVKGRRGIMAFIVESERKIPVSMKVDVIVAGGGVAGLSAAIASARNGANTVLIERLNALGGLGSMGMVAVWYYPYSAYKGILKEMADTLRKMEAISVIPAGMTYEPEAFKQMAFDMCEESNVKVLLYSWIASPIMEGNRIKGVIIENIAGRQAILADVVVDCTGDLCVAASAGAPYSKGRERDKKLRYVTVMARVGNVDISKLKAYVTEHPEEIGVHPFNVLDTDNKAISLSGFSRVFAKAIENSELDPSVAYARFEGPLFLPNSTILSNTSRIYGIDSTNPEELTRAEFLGRKQVSQYLNALRRNVPGFESAVIVGTSSTLGVRRTRRLIGEYVYTENDFSRDFEDSILKFSISYRPGLDIHDPDSPTQDMMEELKNPSRKERYTINLPFRCLLPTTINGLLTAGRSISTSHIVDFYTGNMVPCIGTGQAAGTAAAMCTENRIGPRELNVSTLIDVLDKQGPLDFRTMPS